MTFLNVCYIWGGEATKRRVKRPWLSESLQWYRIRRLIAISLWSFLYIMYCGFCPTRQGPLWKYHMNCSPHIYAFIKKQQVACLLGSYYFTWSATTEIKRPVRKQTKPFNGKSFQRGSLKACSTSSKDILDDGSVCACLMLLNLTIYHQLRFLWKSKPVRISVWLLLFFNLPHKLQKISLI